MFMVEGRSRPILLADRVDASGITQRQATLAHGAAIYGAAQVTLPALEIAPPSIFWGAKEIAIDALHHAVYAAATGVAYRAIAS